MMRLLPLAVLLCTSLAGAQTTARTYRVQQTVTLSEIPPGTQRVAWWVAIPGDDRHQEVLDVAMQAAPASWMLTREPDRGNRFVFLEVARPTTRALQLVMEFTVRRQAVIVEIDPARVGPITETHRRLFAEELRTDAPHMAVTAQVSALAERACGAETNLAVLAKALLAAVAASADHYSKNTQVPTCGVGDAEQCLLNGGGCCTDLHSLFIALARARGIPARLQMGYRLLEKNDGKEVDPGYRCWVEYFLPGYGWIPADIVEADAEGGLGPAVWFHGLTDRRLWLNEGREFDLRGRAQADRINTMVIGYAEIDGVPARLLPEGDRAAQLSRKVLFREVKAP